jgi:hypothetical protein
MIRTPHMDALAARGVHRIGFWDNAIPYDGSVPLWAGHSPAPGDTPVFT